jgi:hypothetical protein
MQLMSMAFSLAADKAGRSRLAKMAIMAMTTNNSMSVNPFLEQVVASILFTLGLCLLIQICLVMTMNHRLR